MIFPFRPTASVYCIRALELDRGGAGHRRTLCTHYNSQCNSLTQSKADEEKRKENNSVCSFSSISLSYDLDIQKGR